MSRATRWDTLINKYNGLGTNKSRAGGVRTKSRRPWARRDISNVEAASIIKRALGALPVDALKGLTIQQAELGAEIQQALDDVGLIDKLTDGLYDARRDGGAALWMVCEGAEDYAKPLSEQRPTKLAALHVLSRWDLRADVTSIIDDALDRRFGWPAFYDYIPPAGGKPVRLHHSHLVIILGDSVPPELRSTYQYWGASMIEGIFDGFAAYVMANKGASEVAYEFGAKKFKLDNLNEMITGGEGVPSLQDFTDAQLEMFGVLRALVVGPDDEVDQFSPTLSGFGDLYDRIAQAFNADCATPATKLYGQTPGGLSTNDQAAEVSWSSLIGEYRRSRITPAANAVIDTLMATTEGPTKGQAIPYTVEYMPQPSTPSEEAEVLSKLTGALGTLVEKGIITKDEARDRLRALKLLPLSDAGAKGTTAATEPTAPVMPVVPSLPQP
jgi:uncharacterized protein